jgi:hypothetical protein
MSRVHKRDGMVVEPWRGFGKNWSVHSIIPKEREWLSVLVCVNAADFHIPNFYIFRGKSFQRDYIKQCEDHAAMLLWLCKKKRG